MVADVLLELLNLIPVSLLQIMVTIKKVPITLITRVVLGEVVISSGQRSILSVILLKFWKELPPSFDEDSNSLKIVFISGSELCFFMVFGLDSLMIPDSVPLQVNRGNSSMEVTSTLMLAPDCGSVAIMVFILRKIVVPVVVVVSKFMEMVVSVVNMIIVLHVELMPYLVLDVNSLVFSVVLFVELGSSS